MCRAQNWEGRIKVSLVITTKRREQSPVRIIFKMHKPPEPGAKAQKVSGRGWGGKGKTKGKRDELSGWRGN